MSVENNLNRFEDDKKIAPIPEWVKDDPEWQRQQAEKEHELKAAAQKVKGPPPPPPPPRRKKSAEQSKLRDEQEIKNLRGGLGLENPENQEQNEIEKLAKEFKEGFEKGKVAYCINGKIPMGSSYRGYRNEDNSTSLEYDHVWYVKKEGIKAVGANFNPFSLGDWEKLGDNLVTLMPLVINRDVVKTIVEEKRGFFGGIKKTEKQEKINERVNAKLSDFSVKDGPDENLYRIGIKYPMDREGFIENREGFLNMNITITEKLAKQLTEEFLNDPKKLFEFLSLVESDLMRLCPMDKNPKTQRPKNLVVYERKSGNVHLERGEKLEPKIVPRL